MTTLRRIQGLKNLIFDAVEGTTNLVQRTHESVLAKPSRYVAGIEGLEEPVELVQGVQRAAASTVYTTIRTVNRSIARLTDVPVVAVDELVPDARSRGLAPTPMRSDAAGSLSWLVDSAESVLNGFIGDFLHSQQNQLALGLSLRHGGRVLLPTRAELLAAHPAPTGKLCIFVHGLSCTEWSWSLFADRYYGDPKVTFGTRLAADLGYTPLYVRYNTGRHISENGHDLSRLIDEVVEEFPVPVDEVALIGHSMGGLVVRSAAHYGGRHEATWVEKLRHVVSISSPHLGAPLEKGTNVLASLLSAFDTPGTQVPAAILNLRSAGIKDLRFGYTIDEEWRDENVDALLEDHRQQVPFVEHAGYYFIASTITKDPLHPASQLVGDLLVRLPSAAGHHPEPTRRVPFHFGHVLPRMHHFHVVNHPDVYDQIRALFSGALPSARPRARLERKGSHP